MMISRFFCPTPEMALRRNAVIENETLQPLKLKVFFFFSSREMAKKLDGAPAGYVIHARFEAGFFSYPGHQLDQAVTCCFRECKALLMECGNV